MVAAGIEFAFWAEDGWMPPISRVVLPAKWKGEVAQYYERQLRQAFQGKAIERMNVQGTGDPFVLISRQWVEAVAQAKVFGWKAMIDAELQYHCGAIDEEDRYAMMARQVNRIAILTDGDIREFTDGNQGRWDFGL